jgi:L-galactose dehydrogenase
MEYRSLGRTSLKVSKLGFGASPLGNVFGRTDTAETDRAVHSAIDQGINFFDVSPYYGVTLAEERLGGALLGRREQVVLATKCGRYGDKEFDFSRSRIRQEFEESLRRLKTDHVDLLQAHDIEFGSFDQIISETIPAMRELQAEGKVRFIGITGYPLKMLMEVARLSPVDTILSYCRYNLMTTEMDKILTPFVEQQGIGLINASPLAMGMLTQQGVPDWHPASSATQEAARRAVRLCTERGVDISTLALQFCLAHPYVSTTLVGMATVHEVETNLHALTSPLDRDLIQSIRKEIGDSYNSSWSSGKPENQD